MTKGSETPYNHDLWRHEVTYADLAPKIKPFDGKKDKTPRTARQFMPIYRLVKTAFKR